MPQIYQGQSLGGSLGSAFGTGLGGTLSQLANQRANRLKQQSGLSGVPGISPEQAEQLANLDPQTLGPVLKELISQPRRAAFGNAVSQLGNKLFQTPRQPGQPGENQQEEAPLDLSQLNPQEALQLINTQLNAENRRSQQEEKQREFDERLAQRKSEQEEKSALKKEEQDLKYNNSVKPFLKQKAAENHQFGQMRKIAQRMKKNLLENKSKFPGALVGNLPESGRRLLIRDPNVRKYIADADKLVILSANVRKGQPTNYKTQLERFAKADISQPIETQLGILDGVIEDADLSDQETRFISSSKDKESGRYPLDIDQRLSNFEIQQREGLPNPFDYSEDTIIEVNGKTFKRNGDTWEEVRGGQ